MLNRKGIITHKNKIPIVSLDNILGEWPDYSFTYSTTFDYSLNADVVYGQVGIGTNSNIYLQSESLLKTTVWGQNGILSTSFSNAVRTYNYSGLYFDSDNSYYIAGLSSSGSALDGKVEKYSHTNTLQWSFNYSSGGQTIPGSFSSGEANAIYVDSSKNVYVAGWRVTPSDGGGSFTYSLIKLSSTGSLVWRKDTGHSIFAMSSDGTYLYTLGNSNPLKIDFDGVTIATYSALSSYTLPKNTADSLASSVFNLLIDNNNNRYYSFIRSIGQGYLTISKYDQNQNLKWTYDVPGGSEVGNYLLSLDKANEILFTKAYNSSTVNSYDKDGFFINSFTSSGYITAINYNSNNLYMYSDSGFPSFTRRLKKITITFSLI